ncbi:hypothetical protein [Dongia sp.]|uniref:hypothetical protein n=1 Tax=Dongia sp. TaxID=1977262 RepID=UPI0035ADF732
MKLPTFLLLPLLAACAAAPTDRLVNLQLTNTGAEILSCKIIYGHWVERDLGPLAPGTTFDIALRQQISDHALFVNRDDMARRMMIENIVCGRVQNWRDTTGQIDLTRPRQQPVAYLEATCAAAIGPGRVECDLTDIAP